jgi:hypothetical protein
MSLAPLKLTMEMMTQISDMQMVASGACNSIIFEKISSKNTMNHDQQI